MLRRVAILRRSMLCSCIGRNIVIAPSVSHAPQLIVESLLRIGMVHSPLFHHLFQVVCYPMHERRSKHQHKKSESRSILQLTSRWLSGTSEMVGDAFLLRRFLLRFQHDMLSSSSWMFMVWSRGADAEADERWAAGRIGIYGIVLPLSRRKSWKIFKSSD